MSTKPVTIDLSSLGLGTGYSTSNVVTQLVALKKAPITALQTTQSSLKAAATALAGFSAKLSAVRSAAKDLADPSHFASYAATSSGTGVVASVGASASATSAATYTVSVAQLAQAQRTVSDPQTSSTAPLGQSGTLSITINGRRSDVMVTADQSLASVASALTKAARVSAAVVYDGARYRLQLRGLDSGAQSTIAFDETGGVDLGLGHAGNTSVTAQDAVATVDGLAVTSPTNQLKGAIDGVTLALTAVTSTPISVAVQPDSTALATKIGSLVAAYNDVVAFAHANAGYGGAGASNTALQSDHAMQASLSSLKKLMSAAVPGATGAYTTLGSVGLRLANDGTASLDASKLASAVQAEPSAVRGLFVTDRATGASGVMKSFASAIDALTTSFGAPVAAEISRFNARASSLDRSISAAQRRVASYQAQLESKFTSVSTTISTERAVYGQVGGGGRFI